MLSAASYSDLGHNVSTVRRCDFFTQKNISSMSLLLTKNLKIVRGNSCLNVWRFGDLDPWILLSQDVIDIIDLS